MYKDTSYQEKFVLLMDWLPEIFETVKKDLKNEHLRQDPLFFKTYFPGKQVQKLTTEELMQGYTQAIASASNGESIAEFIVNRWLLKNGEVYNFFEQELSKINPNFTELNELSSADSQQLIHSSSKKFGIPTTYLFSVLNSVVFPAEAYEKLKAEAKQAKHQQKIDKEQEEQQKAENNVKRNYEMEIARLTDKYEKKLSGMMKKYQQDTDQLKKQIALLQRKLETV